MDLIYFVQHLQRLPLINDDAEISLVLQEWLFIIIILLYYYFIIIIMNIVMKLMMMMMMMVVVVVDDDVDFVGRGRGSGSSGFVASGDVSQTCRWSWLKLVEIGWSWPKKNIPSGHLT